MPKIVIEKKGRVMRIVQLRYFQVCAGASLLFFFLAIGMILWRLFPELHGQQVVPLHYNIHYGVDRTGAWWQIFTLPASGLVIMIANTLVMMILAKREIMLAKFVAMATVILLAFLFVATIFMVLLNVVYG